MRFSAALVGLLLSSGLVPAAAQSGRAAYDAFTAWRTSSVSRDVAWDQVLDRYRAKLKTQGLDDAAIRHAIAVIESYDEGVLYDEVYAKPAEFNTRPNTLLVEAIQGRTPGRALDAAMGQGRNSMFLAGKGWEVTGFDVSTVGLQEAERLAKSRAVRIHTVRASDLDFPFGNEQWDLIALIYLIEKRSVHRVRAALKPGGLIVVEAGHKSTSGAPFEYDSNELLKIFEGFRILRYEETTAVSDWGKEPIRLVRLIAEKPR